MTGRLPWGLDLPLRPFFGVMGVAPPASWGLIPSIQPRCHGGNIDGFIVLLRLLQPLQSEVAPAHLTTL